MPLIALRIRTVEDKEDKNWRFTPGVGAFRNFSGIQVSPGKLNALAAALSTLTCGTDDGLLLEARLQLSTNGGDNWVIHRASGRLTYARNGSVVPTETALSELRAALVDAVSNASAATPLEPLANLDQLIWSSGGLELVAHGAPAVPSLDAMAMGHARETAATTSVVMGIPRLADPRILGRLGAKIEPLLVRLAELQLQIKTLESVTEPNGRSGPSVDQLRTELDLINRIDEIATPLLDPALSSTVLLEQLERADTRLKEGLSSLGLASLPQARTIREWAKPLQTLARLEAIRPLAAESEERMRVARDVLEPAWAGYLQLLERTLQRDSELTTRVEQALTRLAIRQSNQAASRGLNTDSDPSRRTSLGLTWFDRFKAQRRATGERTEIRDDQAGSATGQGNEPVLDAATQGIIESARHAAAEAMNRVSSIQGTLADTAEERTSTLANLAETRQKVVAEASALAAEWERVAIDHGLPMDSTLAELTTLVESHANLFALHDEVETARRRLANRKEALRKLAEAIGAWRSQTGSQKATPLENPQILISEANQILRYRDDRETQLARARAASDTAKVQDVARDLLSRRKATHVSAWKQAFQEAGATAPIRTSDPRIERLIRDSRLVRACIGLGGKTSTPGRSAKELLGTTPVRILTWQTPADPDSAVNGRAAVLAALQDAKVTGSAAGATGTTSVLVITDDPTLAMAMQKIGCGRATPTAVQSAPEAQPVTSKPAPENDLNRAAAVLKARPQPVTQRPMRAPGATATPTGAASPSTGGLAAALQAPRETPKRLLSERAQAALETLTGMRPK